VRRQCWGENNPNPPAAWHVYLKVDIAAGTSTAPRQPHPPWPDRPEQAAHRRRPGPGHRSPPLVVRRKEPRPTAGRNRPPDQPPAPPPDPGPREAPRRAQEGTTKRNVSTCEDPRVGPLWTPVKSPHWQGPERPRSGGGGSKGTVGAPEPCAMRSPDPPEGIRPVCGGVALAPSPERGSGRPEARLRASPPYRVGLRGPCRRNAAPGSQPAG